MSNEQLEDRYANHNKLVVDRHGRLVRITWDKGQATDYEVTGVKETLSFTLRKLVTKNKS